MCILHRRYLQKQDSEKRMEEEKSVISFVFLTIFFKHKSEIRKKSESAKIVVKDLK